MFEFSLEERLSRIEKKLFPDNIKKIYDYTLKCSGNDKRCPKTPHALINQLQVDESQKCYFCGSSMLAKNIFEHEKVIFETES